VRLDEQRIPRSCGWQRSKALAVAVYRLTNSFSTDFGLRDQMRRAAVSVCSNIAEGDARNSSKEAVQFFFIAKGSLAELPAQLEIAQEVHHLPAPTVLPLISECEARGAMLRGLINHRRE
jgi:four helix bundle protein